MVELSIPLVLLAGVVSFASPCFLPIVPVYVGYVTGSRPGEARPDRARVLVQAVAFVAGFTAVFVGLWAAFGALGYAVGEHRDLLRTVGGAVLMVMGLHLVGLVDLAVLERTVRSPLRPLGTDGGGRPPTLRRSLLLGVAFAAGWTPCIGPVLGGVIGVASTSGGLFEGTLLLLTYSVGLGLPFVLVALGAEGLARHLRWFQRHQRAVSRVSGVLLLAIGFVMITDDFARLAALVPALGL